MEEVLKNLEKWPRISIVTPSYNQGMFIGETIESVLAQNYPNLEHIIVDGASKDQTLQILKAYSHLKIISEPDSGQAEAINKGFRIATGKIYSFLNSDDTLLPDALQRVAQEIDPEKGKHIVMGRCRFIDEKGRYLGIEHPSHFESHFGVLKVWKGHLIPQPSVFWTKEVWEKCGGIDELLKSHWIDYDLFCRFSKKHHFYCIDQVFSTYRLHVNSKSLETSIEQRLEEAISVSKRYWGSPLFPQFWRLTMSLALYRFNRVGRARNLFADGKEAWRHKKRLRALMYGASAGLLAPEVAFYLAVYPFFKDRTKWLVKNALGHFFRAGKIDPQTAVYLDHVDPWDDKRIGPRLLISREAKRDSTVLLVVGNVDLTYMNEPLCLIISIDGQKIGELELKESGHFESRFVLPTEILPGVKNVEIRATSWYVPHHFLKNGDLRPLSWLMERVEFVSDKEMGA